MEKEENGRGLGQNAGEAETAREGARPAAEQPGETGKTGAEQPVSADKKAEARKNNTQGAAESPGGGQERREAAAPADDGKARFGELEKKLGEKDAELAKQKNLLLRTAAEYDNYRKRTAREKTAVYADATAAAVLEILPVEDSLERALDQKECSAEDMRRGVELVQKQMQSAFGKLGIEEMGREGEPFNPEFHNAISHVEDKDLDENIVAKVFQKGYKIGNRVIRHAMVQVAN